MNWAASLWMQILIHSLMTTICNIFTTASSKIMNHLWFKLWLLTETAVYCYNIYHHYLNRTLTTEDL